MLCHTVHLNVKTHCFTGGQAVTDCSPCSAGFYCQNPGLSQPTGPCQPGFYCPGNETISLPDPPNFLCPPGSYCLEGSSQPVGCPAGESQPDAGKWFCTPCPAGYYCLSSTIPDPQPCTPFHYCPQGNQS